MRAVISFLLSVLILHLASQASAITCSSNQFPVTFVLTVNSGSFSSAAIRIGSLPIIQFAVASTQTVESCLSTGTYNFTFVPTGFTSFFIIATDSSSQEVFSEALVSRSRAFAKTFYFAGQATMAPTAAPYYQCINHKRVVSVQAVGDSDLSQYIQWNVRKLNSLLPSMSGSGSESETSCLSCGVYAFDMVNCRGGGGLGTGSIVVSIDGTVSYDSSVDGYTSGISKSAYLEVSCDCPSGQKKFNVAITKDDKPQETSWNLVKLDGDAGLVGNKNFGESDYVCVSPGQYMFEIFDCGADGICCDYGFGSYTLSLDSTVFKIGARFERAERTFFNVTA